MTIKQKISYGTIQKVCYMHNDIFHSFHSHSIPPGHTLSIAPLLCHSLNLRNFNKHLYIWFFQRIKLYQRRKEIAPSETYAFLDTHVCIKNTY